MTDQNRDAIDYWIRNSAQSGRLRSVVSIYLKIVVWRGVLLATYGLKRTLDVCGSFLALVCFSPILLITAILVKSEDGGPIFFKQVRVGYRGREFKMWKFRSMRVDAEKLKDSLLAQNEVQGAVMFKMKQDPRVTRIGRFIRKYSIDELPQFWNVLIGDMSLVGPRPSVPREVSEYGVADRLRLLAKPGITCLWQVSGRSEINFEGQVKLDVEYIRSRSVWTDIKLLLRTVPAVLLGKGAY